jgi:hypothetical protein
MNPKQFVISEGLANAVLQYLGNRPFVEVAGMIQELTKMQPYEPMPVPGPGPEPREKKDIKDLTLVDKMIGGKV